MLKKIAAAAALAIVASTAAAADAPAFYIGADVGQTRVDGVDDYGIKDNDTSVGIFAGYQLNQTFAIEANYRRLFDVKVFGASVNADQIGLSAIAGLPLTNEFSLYGRLGYNRINAEVSGNGITAKGDDSGVLYGVGLSYAITPTMSARLEVQRPDSDMTNVSAGVSFKF
ncbi:outer membrane beta-barrel protein [Massilia sp. PAMC28688]|uniref:outer membrane beta-barrel protein n=1 Tax=Massilia sp. PAMC28688 TaxID=2861283 RepID=UPI001C62FE70|nr:outer membrane beta-barrel protein [Massilia sp. PAMC28688]QYF94956.1 outer membrane beta-barrel protein [Massilia sp. PAMC28688]